MNTKEKIEIMQAWVDGKVIECTSDTSWVSIEEPGWNWSRWEYRIKESSLSDRGMVMIAFDRGSEVEATFKNSDLWAPADRPCWDWSTYDYRVKR